MSAELRRWMAALGALQTEIDAGVHGELGGADKALSHAPRYRERLEETYGLKSAPKVRAWLTRRVDSPSPFDRRSLDSTAPWEERWSIERIPRDNLDAFAKDDEEDAEEEEEDERVELTDAAPLLRPHRGVLARAGWAAWDAHHITVVAGWALIAEYVASDALSGHLNQVGARVRALYGSWVEYGYHVLLGEAAHTGAWGQELDRAYQRLLHGPTSPWVRVPWEAYEPRGDGPIPIALKIFLRCGDCERWIAVQRLAPKTLCTSCLSIIETPAKRWRDTLADMIAEDCRAWPEGFVDAANSFEGDVRHSVEYAVRWPRCSCGEKLPRAVLARPPEDGAIACPACGARTTARAPDALVRAIVPDATVVLGETEPLTEIAKTRAASIALSCERCGAPTQPISQRREIMCRYCKHGFRLPDDLWARLFPAPPYTRITVMAGG